MMMLMTTDLILTLTLGPPPDPTAGFTWTYLDRSGHAQKLTTTPLAFAHELDTPRSMSITKSRVHSMFSLVHDPRNEYYQRMSVSRLGNVVGGREITYVNVPMPILKQACVDMLKAGLPVFFGSDVGKFSNREKGIMDTKVIDYELGFNIRLGMDKRQRLLTGESQMTHAMVLTGVHLREGDKGEIVRWRVQNSWGPEVGEHGWFVMSDAWMSEFVYQAVVEPGFVEKRVTDVLKEEKLMLELWDPMGALA